MAHLIAVLVFVFVTNYESTEATSLNCSYEITHFHVPGTVYTCTASVLIDQNDNVTAIYGAHQSGKAHSDVRGLRILSQNLPFFPGNVDAFFPNLLAISLYNNSITSISNSYLVSFPNLRHLGLGLNNISTLDSNLFSGMTWTSSSHFISFMKNNIEHVGHDINLPTNGWLDFSDNPCINERASTLDQISILKLHLLRNCPPTISQIEAALESRPNLLTQLEKRNTQLENWLTQLKSRVAFLEAQIGNKLGLKTDGDE